MKTLGVDVGSLNTKVVTIDNGEVIQRHMTTMSDKGAVIAQKAINEILSISNLTMDNSDYSILTSHIRMEALFVDAVNDPALKDRA